MLNINYVVKFQNGMMKTFKSNTKSKNECSLCHEYVVKMSMSFAILLQKVIIVNVMLSREVCVYEILLWILKTALGLYSCFEYGKMKYSTRYRGG